MKMDRLLGIITILQQKGRVTAPYLAERFEVSRRTIARDIEEICRAGIPIVTAQGAGGGISIMEGFSLGREVLTREDMQLLIAGLGSVSSVSEDGRAQLLAGKLTGGADTGENDVLIDLSSFYKGSLAPKIALLRRAIAARRRVTFTYYYEKGRAEKRIEPRQVVYMWSSWYVLGRCMERGEERMFKLARLWDLRMTDEAFSPCEKPPERKRPGSHMTDDRIVTAAYDPSMMYRLVEEYGPDSFSVMEDGRLLTRWGYSSDERALDWLLSFGSRVEVIAPDRLRERMRREAVKMAALHARHEET